MYTKFFAHYRPLIDAVLIANALSLFLLLARMWATGAYRYWFMLWNLFLAWVALLAVLVLLARLRKVRERWSDAFVVGLFVVWLLFLPNCFYMLTDLIHLRSTGEISLLYDALLLSSFVTNGFLLGYTSVYAVHRQLLKRMREWQAGAVLSVVFLACGFAIYLGRVLRWNSWDVLLNPAGLLFDVTDGIVNPLAHPQVIMTTGTFFLFIGTFYAALYQALRLLGADTVRLTKVYHTRRQ
ncbi:hypothetical protein CR970_02495 [Candidatus Saccharibacteria bacterium]|nr:MAG: hypothetical protein CR970_02495 [Candidatus Saccharibacteria bacterium]